MDKGYKDISMSKNEDVDHDQDNKLMEPISKDIDTNIKIIEDLLTDCGDIVKRKFPVGAEKNIWVYIAYIDGMCDRQVIEESIIENLMVHDRGVPPNDKENKKDIMEFIKDGGMATADMSELDTLDKGVLAILSGDALLLIDGYEKAFLISSKHFPNRGIPEPDSENVIRGPKDGFSEVFRFNTALIRRRIRDTKLKLKQYQLGTRSRTDVGVMYIEDIVRPEVLKELEDRMTSFKIDSILDSGILEQFIQDDWCSPFPQIQATQRPDKVASSLLEGRVAIVVDNSPYVIIVPATINCFFQSSEDYYERWMIMSFVRVIRYVSAFISISLPGLYIALTTFHPAMIPSSLTFSIAASREGVPFPAIIEVLLMELAFELLREAGIRLPGPIGNTIGIVGGLIIGQAAVEANIVSPIIVIVVALTAIASFSIPNDELVTGIRLTKFLIIGLSSVLGLYGYILSVVIILVHLMSLKSYGIPYLAPFVVRELNKFDDIKDALIRMPLIYLNRRPIFSRIEERTRLKFKKKNDDKRRD